MKKLLSWFLNPPVTGPSTFLIIRLLSGGVFFCEGLLNLCYGSQGSWQFESSPLLPAEIVGYLVFGGQVVGGLLLMFGLFTRITGFYFLMYFFIHFISPNMTFYMGSNESGLSTKVVKSFDWLPLYYKLSTHYAQLLAVFFLMIEGPGRMSVDFRIATSGDVYSIVED